MKTTVITALLWLSPLLSQAMTPAEVQQQVDASVRQQQQVQRQIDTTLATIDRLRQELRQKQLLLRWTEHQNRQYQGYIDRQNDRLQGIERQRDQARQLRIALEPELPILLQRLKAQVAQDLPFHAQERQQRLASLDAAFADPTVAMSQRVRRLFEALQIEAGFGQTVEVAEDSILLNSETIFGQTLRLGRRVQFFVSRGGETMARRLPGQEWQRLDRQHAAALTDALQQVQQQRFDALLPLPLGPVTP